MSLAVFGFADEAAPLARLGEALGAPAYVIPVHRFPDGESLPVVEARAQTAVFYRGLADPDPKLMPLLLAADALRRYGARRVVLAAPYLPYLRQDAVFAPGQPLSRDVLGALLGPAFDRIVTVEPHLHRTNDLTPVFGGKPVTVLSAAPALAQAIGAEPAPVIVGPDGESEAWTARVAAELGADHWVFAKQRLGDRAVVLAPPPGATAAGRRAVLVDDICSSGATLQAALEALRRHGAATVDVAVVHALFDSETQGRLASAGARRIISTDSCPHPTNTVHLARLLVGALKEELLP